MTGNLGPFGSDAHQLLTMTFLLVHVRKVEVRGISPCGHPTVFPQISYHM